MTRALRFGRRHRAALALAVVASLVLAGGGVALAAAHGLPAFGTLRDYRPLTSTRVYGADGSEVFEFHRERRTVVPFEEIPDVLKKAVLASEDAHFYQHEGVNYLAIARCALKNVVRGHTFCGASTITQQVVRTFLLSSEKRITRKLKEIVLARRLEQNLKKDEILFLYLNQIYFGHQRYGVEEAARFYFGKGVRDLTVGEAALIAGLVQSPERLSPVKHPDAAKERQRYVLRRMAEEGFVSQKTADAETAKPIHVVRRTAEPPGASYADAVRRYLDQRYGAERVETDGLVVDVAMDPAQQRAAEDALEAQLRAVDRRQGWRGAPHHLDERQIAAAMPLWRERLKSAGPPDGSVVAWDLGRVSRDDIEPGNENEKDIRRMASVKPLLAGGTYSVLVTHVSDRTATVDLGNATGTLDLSDVRWARKWNPSAYTPAPRRMKDVLQRGDIVLVRVAGPPSARSDRGRANGSTGGARADGSSKANPAELARARKPVPVSLEQVPKVQGAFVAIDPATRGVRALVGGYDFALSQFNRAIQARRQPGSAFKPFVWGAAIESRRYTPATVVYDTPDLFRDPWTGKEWKPQNFERDEYQGPILLQQALAHSKNTVSAKLVDQLGVDAVIGVARRCGVESELPRTLSLALGVGEVTPLELVNAYATIAARGFATPPLLVLRVRDRKGQVLEEHPPVTPPPAYAPTDGVVPAVATSTSTPAASPSAQERSPASPSSNSGAPPPIPPPHAVPASGLEPEVAYVLTSMMRDVIEYGTGASARSLGRPLAGKTGTAQDHRDAWFVGFSPDLVAGAWVGFDSHEPLGNRETGAAAALPAWMAFMRETLGRSPVKEFPLVRNVELARVDSRSGALADPSTPDALLFSFVAGTVPAPAAASVEAPAPQGFFMDDN